MKIIYNLLVCFSLVINAFGQQLFYVCAGGNLQRLNAATCDTTFIGSCLGCGSIAITADGRLYGLDYPDLYEIDTSNASVSLITSNLSHSLAGVNSLVADSVGNLLTIGNDDSLYQINRLTGQSSSLGYVGFWSAGDLTFYNDTLYLAGGNCCVGLIKIILHPSVSAQLIDTFNTSLDIFGLNTICINNSETMVATGGNQYHTNLYKVNPANASLSLLCDSIVHTIIGDAASIYDVSGSGGEVMCSTLTGVLNEHSRNNNVEVFPNPFTDKLTVHAKSSEPLEIVIYDIASQKIMWQNFTTSLSLNTSPLAKGVYIYEIKHTPNVSGGVIERGKIVKF